MFSRVPVEDDVVLGIECGIADVLGDLQHLLLIELFHPRQRIDEVFELEMEALVFELPHHDRGLCLDLCFVVETHQGGFRKTACDPITDLNFDNTFEVRVHMTHFLRVPTERHLTIAQNRLDVNLQRR